MHKAKDGQFSSAHLIFILDVLFDKMVLFLQLDYCIKFTRHSLRFRAYRGARVILFRVATPTVFLAHV